MSRYPHRRKIGAQLEFMSGGRGSKPMQLDTNHTALVEHAALFGGWFVRAGPLDGWCWFPRGVLWMPVEIKVPGVEGDTREYTPQQRRFMRWCLDHGAPWWIWRTMQDVEKYLGARRT